MDELKVLVEKVMWKTFRLSSFISKTNLEAFRHMINVAILALISNTKGEWSFGSGKDDRR